MIRQFAIEFAMHAIVGVGFARCRCEVVADGPRQERGRDTGWAICAEVR